MIRLPRATDVDTMTKELVTASWKDFSDPDRKGRRLKEIRIRFETPVGVVTGILTPPEDLVAPSGDKVNPGTCHFELLYKELVPAEMHERLSAAYAPDIYSPRRLINYNIFLLGFDCKERCEILEAVGRMPERQVEEVATVVCRIRRSLAPVDDEARRELVRDIVGIGPF